MTVAELITKLQRYPPDTLVMVPDWHDGALTAKTVEDTCARWRHSALLATTTSSLHEMLRCPAHG